MHKKAAVNFIDANPSASVVEVTDHLLKWLNAFKASHKFIDYGKRMQPFTEKS